MAPRRKLNAQIPAILVRAETREKLLVIASAQERSLSDVVREAVEFFLSQNDTFSANDGAISTEKEATQ